MIDIFWFFIALLLVTVFAWLTWPYTWERWVYRRGGGSRPYFVRPPSRAKMRGSDLRAER